MRRIRVGVGLFLASVMVPACGTPPSSMGTHSGSVQGTVTFSDADIETFPDEGNTHVPVGTVIAYRTDPPTSGNHYPDPQPGGFYTQPILPGFLVHSMEHGGVIIYYHDPALTGAQRNRLRDLAKQHPGTFSQVVV